MVAMVFLCLGRQEGTLSESGRVLHVLNCFGNGLFKFQVVSGSRQI